MQEQEAQNLREWLNELDVLSLSHDRHLLLERIVALSYKYRHQDINMRRLAECVGWIHFDEFEDLLEHIPVYVDNQIFPPATFPKLATLFTEAGRYEKAIEICRKALSWGLNDGTKSGYRGRIERIKKRAENDSDQQRDKPIDCDTAIQNVKAEIDVFLRKIEAHQKVPILDIWQTELSVKALDVAQHEFFKQWVASWKQQKPIDIEYQVGYVFLYIQSDLLRRISEQTINELIKLREQYGADQPDDLRRLRYYCGAWASDCCVYLGQYRRAITIFPDLYINHLLSLKIMLDEDLSGDEVLRLFGQTNLTEYGKSQYMRVVKAIETLLHEYRELNGASIIEKWAAQVDTQKYRLFNSSSRFRELNITAYRFEDDPIKEIYIDRIKALIREAENQVREAQGIPRIGEGWVSETQLYYQIKEAFPDLEVQQHASPEWLGRQHLDIFLPEIQVAIEYQGRQHDEPIEFFGGESAFQYLLMRDAKKRSLCHQNGIKLIEVRPDYLIEELINRIRREVDS